MIVLRKKRLVLMICFLCLSFSVYFVANDSNKIDTKNRNYDITQVSSIPATGKVVVIDAGHGGEDGRSYSELTILVRQVLILKLP